MKDMMVIFDLDGTLWDSSEEVARSWNEVFEKRNTGYPHLTRDDIQNVMGKTMEEIAKTLLPVYDEKGRDVFAECERYEVDYIAEHGGTLYDGAEDVLKALTDDGYRLAIVSNCQQGYIGAFLKSMDMGEYFCDTEEWGNTFKSKGENIRLVMERNGFDHAVYVGDTLKDMDASREVGIPFIYAKYGFGEINYPEHEIDSLDELPKVVSELEKKIKYDRKFGTPFFMHRNFAHRGLHDEVIPENSLAAFRAACEAGYGSELDVQLSADGEVIVFHDDSLERMCGTEGSPGSKSYAELKKLSLAGTDEHIPLFSEVLDVMKEYDVPIIVELKNGPENFDLCTKTLKLLREYKGAYCIESFNPLIVEWFRKNAPDVFRGQLAGPAQRYKRYSKLVQKVLSECRYNNKPDFIAYEIGERPKRILKMRKKGVMLIGWTSREPDEDQEANDAVIFEGYRPEPKY